MTEEVLPWVVEREKRGGVFVTVDGDEYWAPTVEQLQAAGIKVILKHYRMAEQRPPKNRQDVLLYGLLGTRMATKGGKTEITLLAPDGYWSKGEARCSRKDAYSKKAGYVLAVNRALSELGGQFYAFEEWAATQIREAGVEES